jgi:glycine/D-amino acid oxidase-like deaminating enzyme
LEVSHRHASDSDDEPFDVLVVGGGVVGAATALAAATRGARTALVERSPAGCATGSSKGSARIVAPAAYPDHSYLEMGLDALRSWQRIEATCGERLLDLTGALSVGEFSQRGFAALQKAGAVAELVSGPEVRRRFGAETHGRPALFQADAGVIRADRAHAALIALAREAGTEIHFEETALSIAEGEAGVEISTDQGSRRCAVVILAAGAWAAPLAATAGIALDAVVTSQSVAYFSLLEGARAPVALMDFDGEEPYALADPRHGLKAAFHAHGEPVATVGDPAEAEGATIDRLAGWVAGVFPDLGAELVDSETCLYTRTPNERFVLERHGRVVIAAACNGQGFQLAPATADHVVGLALEPAEAAVR